MDWMPYRDALQLGALLLGIGLVWRPAARWGRPLPALCREASLVLGLYALWNYLATLQLRHVDGAMAHGRAVWDVERALHLPSEARLQELVLPYDGLARLADQYYAWVHVPALMIFLVWLFLRHRDRYPGYRTSLVLLTGICFVIQITPVAPPRFYPELGFVDTANLHGESVYAHLGIPVSSQVDAMPSVHVAWAVFIAWTALAVSRSPWRWGAVAHGVVTVLVVVVTANHWWLDGIAALAILALIRAARPPGAWVAAAVRGWADARLRAAPTPALAVSEQADRGG